MSLFLPEMYHITEDKKYLAEAEQQMVLPEAFSGKQSDYHLNEIAIRHRALVYYV